MIRLATRLVVSAGRETTVRLALTAVGIGLATAMLLFAAVAFPALRSHDERRGWIDTAEQNQQPAQDESTTDPLLWRLTETRFDGQDLVRVDMAAEGPDAPVPPGLDKLPGAGQLAVSPALGDLLEREPAMLADRFPGEVTATIGDEALVSPDDLVVFVGRSVDELETESDVLTVRSIEAAPFSRNLTRIMRVAVAAGGVGLLAPVIMFVATATRLAAARRERRLAAMRLAGATPRQVGVVSAVEAAFAAVAGTALGFGLFFAIRPSLANVPFDGATFFPSDLRLSWSWAVAIALGVPCLAVATAMVSLRRARISPLGVTQRAMTASPSPWPLTLVAAGLVGMVLVQGTMTGASDILVASAVAGTLLVMIVGIMGSGAWLTTVVARALARAGRRAPSLLAARRLQDNPAAGFRTIGGLILAVFVGTVFSSFTASVLATTPGENGDGMRPGIVTAALSPDLPPEPVDRREAGLATSVEWPELDPSSQAEIEQGLSETAGVNQIATAHALPAELVEMFRRQDQITVSGEPVAMSCDDVSAIGLDPCEGTTVITVSGNGIQTTGLDITDDLGADELGSLQTVGFAAITDGSSTAIEQARTQLERHMPGSIARTQADLDAENQSTARTTQRISNIALAVTLVIAGCSLAVAVAGSIIERQQPFALLRLAGTRLSDLRRIVLTEAAVPLLAVAVVTSVLGLAVTALTLESSSDSPPFTLPDLGYWLALLGGLAVAMGVVAATLPLLSRLTSPESVRFE